MIMKYLLMAILVMSCADPVTPVVEPDDIPENRITFITEWNVVDDTLIVTPMTAMMPYAIVADKIHIEVISAGVPIFNGSFPYGSKQYSIPWQTRKQIQIAFAYILKN